MLRRLLGALTGRRGGSAISNTDDPDDSFACGILARIYCDLASQRDHGISKNLALRKTNQWLADDFHSSITYHVKQNFIPLIYPAAEYVYSHPERSEWTTYYHGAYMCVAARKSKTAFNHFQKQADKCEARFVGKGGEYDNPEIADCLKAALKNPQVEVGPLTSAPGVNNERK